MFKTLYKETEGFRLVSILTPLCMIGEVVMEMLIPQLMSSIIDDGVTAGNLSHIYRIGGWMIVATARFHRLRAQPAPFYVPQYPDIQFCQH